ncbi:MAG: hypothetical protein KFB95_06805 [Simkaniaceae bacterium]|nr:MAG: hypothetical protein KFB95_06805 [Simkaniaceae bacterium]
MIEALKTSSHLSYDRTLTAGRIGSVYYVDQGYSSTEVKFLDGERVSYSTRHFDSRDDMLYHIAKERISENKMLWENGELTTAERYSGFEHGLMERITGIWSRTKYIIAAAYKNLRKNLTFRGSIGKGLKAYDLSLLRKSITKAGVNFSVKDVRDFVVKPNIEWLSSKDLSKTYSIARWHHNGESDYSFINERGQKEVLQNTVVSSNDQSAKRISMMRRIDDYTTDESIAYTGRGDTESKAMEQLNFIFQNELAKNPEAQKGLVETEDGYEFTFMLNNLMSSNLFRGLDERDSILREKAIFDALSERPITLTDKDGNEHTIMIKPLYFNQGFTPDLDGTAWKQTEINREGYNLLFPLIDDAIANNPAISAKDKQLLQAAQDHLRNPSKLKAEEEFFYRDLVMKILKIPVIDHCASSVDQTSLATSISTALQSWRNLRRDIPTLNPHDILTDPLFKELFTANIHGCHQTTQAARSAEGKIDGQQQLSHAHGFDWAGNTSILLRMLPDRYLDESGLNLMHDSPLVDGRRLLKPEGMKLFYTNDHPLIVEQGKALEGYVQIQSKTEREISEGKKYFQPIANKGSYGSYIYVDLTGRKLGVFKSIDAEFSWDKQVKGTLSYMASVRNQEGYLPLPESRHKGAMISERATYLLDRVIGTHSTPKTEIVSADGHIGSFQYFLHGYREAEEVELPKAADINISDLDKYQRFVILDFLLGNLDRKLDNWMVRMTPDGKHFRDIKMIDNANCFPRGHLPQQLGPLPVTVEGYQVVGVDLSMWSQYLWKDLELSNFQLTNDSRRLIASLTGEKVDEIICTWKEDLGLEYFESFFGDDEGQVIKAFKDRVKVLRKFNEGTDDISTLASYNNYETIKAFLGEDEMEASQAIFSFA